MKKFLIIALFSILYSLFFLPIEAQARGIGISPAKIEIEDVGDWPYTVPIFVTNYSSEKELFEVIIDSEEKSVSVTPGRFILEGGEKARILAMFEQPQEYTSGNIQISAVRSSPEGFVTGTGMKIPFQISGIGQISEESSELLANAAVGVGGNSPMLFAWFMIVVALLLLWYVSDAVRKFMLPQK